jgi:hypothetical protein
VNTAVCPIGGAFNITVFDGIVMNIIDISRSQALAWECLPSSSVGWVAAFWQPNKPRTAANITTFHHRVFVGLAIANPTYQSAMIALPLFGNPTKSEAQRGMLPICANLSIMSILTPRI